MLLCRFISLIILLPLLSLSCSKSSKEKDREAPVVVIEEPVHNAIVTGGQVLNIRGNVADNEFIHEIHIEISNLQTGEEYLHVHIHPSSGTHSYSHAFNPVSGISYLVRVIAEDPSNNVSSQKVEFSAN
ncbi:MAG TPA: hypothetical protein PLV32_00305 [Chitinophagaceae bacterium]|nr:hypothetical protein [Chitinophagaceae bacterium]